MVRDFYGFPENPFSLNPNPACYFDPGRINQIARRLQVLAAVEPREHGDAALMAQVLDEWQGNEATPQPGPVLKTRLEAALARCEGQIAELQQAHVQAVPGQDHAALLERLNSLESRMIEQERTIRHTMTILIEWIERDEAEYLAA